MRYEKGDRVVVTRITEVDEENDIKVGDIAKVTGTYGDKWFYCYNPKWSVVGSMLMKYDQLKKP